MATDGQDDDFTRLRDKIRSVIVAHSRAQDSTPSEELIQGVMEYVDHIARQGGGNKQNIYHLAVLTHLEAADRGVGHLLATKWVEDWLGKQMLTNSETARLMGLHPASLSNMRHRKQGPPWIGSGKLVRYSRAAVIVWMTRLSKQQND